MSLDPRMISDCVSDTVALITLVLDEESDQRLFGEAHDFVAMRDGETATEWLTRVTVLVATQAAVASGIVSHLARRIGCEPEDIIRGVAIRHAARQTGGQQ
jgi:hypothetical protein